MTCSVGAARATMAHGVELRAIHGTPASQPRWRTRRCGARATVAGAPRALWAAATASLVRRISNNERFKYIVLGVTVLGLLAILVLMLVMGNWLFAPLVAFVLWVVIDGLRRELRPKRRGAGPNG